MDKFQPDSSDVAIWEIEENFRQCHYEAINELLERDNNVASYFDPLPNYPQIQLLGHIDDCILTFEINNSALSYRFDGKTLQIFLYNKNNWKDKILVGEYLHTRAFESIIWSPVSTRTIPAMNELNQAIVPIPNPQPMPSALLVQHWYMKLINHAIQEYLDEMDLWYRSLSKNEGTPPPDAIAA